MLPALLGAAGRSLAAGAVKGAAARKIASSALAKSNNKKTGGSDNSSSDSPKKISSIKLFSSGSGDAGKGGAIVKASTTKIKAESFKKEGQTISFSKDQFLVVEKQVIQIKDLVLSSTSISKSSILQQKKESEDKSRKEKESSLEKDKDSKEKDGIKMPSGPKLGFFDRIKSFLFKMLVGWVVLKLLPYLPQLAKALKVIAPAFDFIINVSGAILNGLVTFIDWGYKGVTAIQGFIRNIGGNKALELFDKFTSVFATLVNGALILSMILLKSKGAVQSASKLAGGAGKLLTKVTGGVVKGGLAQTATRVGIKIAGKAGGKAIKGLSKVLNKIPVIGGLIDFGINLLLGEPVGRAAAKAAGATAGGALGGIVAGAIGSVVPFAGTALGGIIGSTLGSFLGDWAGGALYDAFAGAKKETQKMAGGGITRGGKRVGGAISRGLKTGKNKKITRKESVKTTELDPGSSVGGKKNVDKIFPESKEKKVVNPQGYIKKTHDETVKARYFGPMFGIAYKTLVGNKPQSIDYKNAASGLNSWMYDNFNNQSISDIGAFAGGGEVNAEMFMRGDNLTRVISKSLEDNVKEKVDNAIRDLKKQLGLKEYGAKGIKDMDKTGKDGPDSLEIDGATVTGGNADFWTLVAISRMEDSDPQGSADVAQSIYNRVASGIYGGKTIKEIVLRQGQYEPTWKYPQRGKTGVPNAEWHAIKDLASASAATGISQGDLQKTAAALKNQTLQEEARKFVGGRTDFMGGANKKGAEDVQRTTNRPNNFFGWFVGPAAKAYGAKKPGPARAPQLGDIVVMGGGGSGGTLGGGKFIQGNSGASRGVHFHIGPGSQVKGTILQRQYFADARATAKQAVDYFLSKGSTVYDGRRRKHYRSGNEVGAAQQAHMASRGSAGGIDMQVDFEKAVPFPLKTGGMAYRPNGFGVSADIAGSNSFVAHGRYDEKGKVAPQEMMKIYHRGTPRVNGNEVLAKLLNKESVLDVDTSEALRKIDPNLISRFNKASSAAEVASILMSYAPYEYGAPQTVEIPEETIMTIAIPYRVGGGGIMASSSGGGMDDFGESMASSQ